MFLKSLTLKGFKSFAEPTTLDMGPGITVVVGPNGSGKSNVVDAIAWVLGAQAPSAVRSQKMDDVIFAGTGRRPALGRAEVSLTIDNAAGLLPIDFTEVTLTRTLFRGGDSEYAINGAPSRLLDIQELLSDTGVGRQQHVVVSQGQIDAVLDARPEERRLIIEEAAGVLKFRRRKDKAQRRLTATEANLVRLGDLVREIRRQLRPLERQADAARRHDGVADELRALRTHLAGRELRALRSRLEAGGGARRELASDEAAVLASLDQLDRAVLAAEARLSAMGTDELASALVRFESLRGKGRGLAAVLVERRRSLERDRHAGIDASVVAAIEAESSRLVEELAALDRAARAIAPEAAALAEAEGVLGADRDRFRAEWSEVTVTPATVAAATGGELAARRESLGRAEAELARARGQLEARRDRGARLARDAARLQHAQAAADESERSRGEALASASDNKAAAVIVREQAERRRRDAESEHRSWEARAGALAQALDTARAQAGVERLAGLDGVIGTLLDLVEIDAGYHDAFAAAAGDALAAVVLADAGAARRALAMLQRRAAPGAVLALAPTAPGPRSVPVSAAGAEGAESLRAHVRSSRHGPGGTGGAAAGATGGGHVAGSIEALLDVLIGSVTVVERWEDALEAALADPAALVVTRDGDRFGPSGWRVGVSGSEATGAALDEARASAATAVARVAQAEREVESARINLAEADRAERDTVAARVEADNRRARRLEEGRRVEAERRRAADEADGLQGYADELMARTERDRAQVVELEAMLPALLADEAEALARARAHDLARRRLDERAVELAARRTDHEVRSAALAERRAYTAERRAELEARLARHHEERDRAATERSEREARVRAIDRLAALVADRLGTVEAELADLHDRRRRMLEESRALAASLDALRRQRAGDERSVGEVRERARRAELEDAETRLRLEAAIERARRELDCEPEAAVDAACPPLPDGATAPGRARELERELRLMGPINPLALQEWEALRERHEFIEAQLDDVRSARRELGRVIRAIDARIVEVFSAAWADVAENFSTLFETLFPGGSGRLVLADPENLLETGIEVEARPSGKNVRKLSLLSGGERSLTALAYLFAVFRSRPSPFYVMDEVEAALDDVNLHRFLDLIHEFRDEAQLIVVSHQKRTMEAADCLYGVTMQPGGSSRVVSERVAARTA